MKPSVSLQHRPKPLIQLYAVPTDDECEEESIVSRRRPVMEKRCDAVGQSPASGLARRLSPNLQRLPHIVITPQKSNVHDMGGRAL
jgi:hypothetical protein